VLRGSLTDIRDRR